MPTQPAVGIDALGVAAPPTYLDLTALAKARGIDPAKFTEGLGTYKMAVPQRDEDTVTLAARAAQMAIESAGIRPEDIGLLAVGTETAVDHSKPVASFVQGVLKLPPAMRVFETKHACYGGTASLQLALDWIRSGSARGKKALVICSDIARYGLRTPGEPTQGAGSVAVLLSENPRLVALDAITGVHSQDVFDFWRPLYSKDALVDGHYSVQCYLDALAGAYAAYKELAGASQTGGTFSDGFAALCYHVPYGKMAKKAHTKLRSLDGDASPETSFDRLVAPSLMLPSQIGNIYTASLYLALASTLTCTKEDLSGKRIGLLSYGSGFCSEFFSGTVQPGAQDRVKALGLLDLLERRTALSIEQYERLLSDEEEVAPVVATKGPRFVGVKDHKRQYTSV